MRTRTWAILGGLAAVVAVGGTTYAYLDAQPPGDGGVTGRYFGLDDTGHGEHPLDDGTFLVIPGATVLGVWPGISEPRDSGYYQGIRPRVDLDDLADRYGALLVEVQPNGRFRINTAPGPTVVCLLVFDMAGDCVEVDLPKRGSLKATFGTAGFHIG